MDQLRGQLPNPVSFHLCSEVGAPIYERLGFKPSSEEWLIPTAASLKPLAGPPVPSALTERDSLSPLLERYSCLKADLHVVPDLLHLIGIGSAHGSTDGS